MEGNHLQTEFRHDRQGLHVEKLAIANMHTRSSRACAHSDGREPDRDGRRRDLAV